MDNSKLGQEPAFPSENVSDGMSKRFYAACEAMKVLISKYDTYDLHENLENADIHDIIFDAYAFADELLKQEATNAI